ncbi:ubiquinone biosynthesis monooxygenase Coq6 [Microdochium nivale]|nr:ubiquinone biosynthesis monooxygenase Coq6 [Microdochium nivale]
MDVLVLSSRRIVRPTWRLGQSCARHSKPQQSRRTYASSTSRPDIYDVVCVGGGPAGLSLLTALRSNPTTAGLRVALVEAQDLSKTRDWKLPADRFSNRCSSFTPTSASFMNTIGAWRHLQQDRVQPYHEMQVWDGVTGARIEFDWEPRSGPPADYGAGLSGSSNGKTIAYMTENLNLTSGLLSRLDELGGTAVFDNAKVEGIAYGEETEELDFREWPIVQLAGGKQLAARLLVGADGANSPVRTFAGIGSQGWDYDRHGVVATLQLEESGWAGIDVGDLKTAYQRFLPTGPIAILPLPGNHASLVWSTTPAKAKLLKSLSPQDFIACVNAAFRLGMTDLEYMHTLTSGGQAEELRWRLEHTPPPAGAGAVPQTVVGVQEGTVASFPLKMRHADTYVGERVALVGDAAHTVHPLAGQGLNQGQADVESLARTIEYAASHGMDIGAQLSLEAYNAERYAANHLLLGVVDKLHKLYSVGSGPLVPLRSLGLSAVNAMRPLKRFFMEQAAGSGGKIF